MENQIKLVKLGLNTGLISKRSSPTFNYNNFSSYFTKDQSTAEKIRVLIRAGVYDIRRPDTESKIREDWYKSPSASTPGKIVKEELKLFNKAHKDSKIKQPIVFNRKAVTQIKKMFQQRKKEQRKSCKPAASVKRYL